MASEYERAARAVITEWFSFGSIASSQGRGWRAHEPILIGGVIVTGFTLGVFYVPTVIAGAWVTVRGGMESAGRKR